MLAALIALTAAWATPATASPTAAFLMRAWYAQNEICRGDPAPRPEACNARAVTERALRAAGWTYDGLWRRVRGQAARSRSSRW